MSGLTSLRQWLPLAILTVAGFTFNTSELMPIGLLSDIAADFGVSEAYAGWLISIYALVVALLVELMKRAFKLIADKEISHGGLTETAVDVRLILKEALLNNATIIVLVHNHPSGNTFPSSFDNQLTQQVKKACETMRIHFADHVIVTDGKYYSYREEGKI